MILLLVLSYVVIAALLLNANVNTRLPLLVKCGAVALVTACYGFAYWGYKALEGWPADAQLPDDFRIQWIAVDEPNKQTGEEGIIYFWVRHLDEYGDAAGEPRAYRVPFSEALAEDAEEALEKIQDGETMNGFITRQVMTPAEEEVDATESRAQDRTMLGDEAMWRIEFRDVPKPNLPPKSTPTG